ncbi:hypothetical protein HG531_011095 [Fusarium graminearum]|nr:hypothetical protein HG531_011095 [Fusarium graminearum]
MPGLDRYVFEGLFETLKLILLVDAKSSHISGLTDEDHLDPTWEHTASGSDCVESPMRINFFFGNQDWIFFIRDWSGLVDKSRLENTKRIAGQGNLDSIINIYVLLATKLWSGIVCLHVVNALRPMGYQRCRINNRPLMVAINRLNARRDAVDAGGSQLDFLLLVFDPENPRRLNIPKKWNDPLLNNVTLSRILRQTKRRSDTRHYISYTALRFVLKHGSDEFGLPLISLGVAIGRVVHQPQDITSVDSLAERVPSCNARKPSRDINRSCKSGSLCFLKGSGFGVGQVMLDLVKVAGFSSAELHVGCKCARVKV